MLGFMLDAFDVMLYVFAVQTLRAEFGWSNAAAGLVSSVTLVASAVGGIVSGVLADRFGRRTMLIAAILAYSCASAGSATAGGLTALLVWRAIVGLGLGGEWSAGAALVAETWPASQRARAVGVMQSGWAIGYILAAGVTAAVLPRFGWRALFLTGLAPALLTLWIQRKVREPEIWKGRDRSPRHTLALFRAPLRRTTVTATAVAASVLFAYWGLFTWLPAFLAAPIARGGAGLSIVQTSGWVVPVQMGAFAGYILFGLMADRIGRRVTFAVYVGSAAVLVPVYGMVPAWAGASAEAWLLGLGPLVGFFGTGYFSLFGAMLAELYPTAVRGAAMGIVYNSGRALSALAPFTVGAAADAHGIGAALAINAAFFATGALLIFFLPETRGRELA